MDLLTCKMYSLSCLLSFGGNGNVIGMVLLMEMVLVIVIVLVRGSSVDSFDKTAAFLRLYTI